LEAENSDGAFYSGEDSDEEAYSDKDLGSDKDSGSDDIDDNDPGYSS